MKELGEGVNRAQQCTDLEAYAGKVREHILESQALDDAWSFVVSELERREILMKNTRNKEAGKRFYREIQCLEQIIAVLDRQIGWLDRQRRKAIDDEPRPPPLRAVGA